MAVPVGMPDQALLTRARDGDGEAFEALYRRHLRAATRAAHSYSSRTELAEDAVQEAFMRILHATQEGGGPKTEFRAYLATTVRHVIAGWTRGERTIVTDELEELAGEDTRESNRPESRLRWHLLTKAFKSLPTRWQEALWLGEVEGVAPAELADRWNMSANSAAALSYRAREGLRTAWLDAHVNEGLVPDECRPFVSDLSRYTQGKLTDRRELQVHTHLDDCAYCRGVLFEVDAAASELRGLLVPVAAWGGLAVAGGSLSAGSLAGLTKLAGTLGVRGLVLGAASTAVVTAVVIVTMNPGIADTFGGGPGAARPFVTLTGASGDGGDAADEPDDRSADATDDATSEPTEDATDGPSEDPASVPTPDVDDDSAPGSGASTRDDPPSGPAPAPGQTVDPTPDPTTPEPTTPPTIPPVAPPTDEPTGEPTDEPRAPAAPSITYAVADDALVLSGEGEPGATITLRPVGGSTASAGNGPGATGRSVTRVPMAPLGAPLADVTVATDGTWTTTPDLDLVVGQRVSAIQTTADGRVSTAATIDLPSRPAAPAIIVGMPEGPSVTVSGQAVAGAIVTLRTVDGPSLPNPVVDSRGGWSATVDLSIWGGLDLVATQQVPQGLRSPVSAAATLPLHIAPLDALTLEVFPLEGGLIRFSGTGHTGALVTVTGDGVETEPTAVNGEGRWSVEIPAAPDLSGVEVVATQVFGEQSSQSATQTIAPIEVPDPPAPPWVVAQVVGAGEAYLLGTGVPGASILLETPDGDHVGQSHVSDILGTWDVRFQDERMAGEGLTVVVIQVVDGVRSLPSAPILLRTSTTQVN